MYIYIKLGVITFPKENINYLVNIVFGSKMFLNVHKSDSNKFVILLRPFLSSLIYLVKM